MERPAGNWTVALSEALPTGSVKLALTELVSAEFENSAGIDLPLGCDSYAFSDCIELPPETGKPERFGRAGAEA